MRMGVVQRALSERWPWSEPLRQWRLRWIWVVLLMHATVCAAAAPDSAPDSPPPSDRVVFSEEPVIRFQGIHSSRTFPFYVSPAWNLTHSGRLHLQMSVSELVQTSNLTVRINGLELRSIPLGGKHPATFVSEVPRESLVPGWNVLELNFYLRSGHEPCRDVDNPGLWVLLKPESGFSIPHQLKPIVPDLAGFPTVYSVPESSSQPPTVVMALTPQSEGFAQALEVAGLLATRLGQARTLRSGSLRGMWVGQKTGGQEGRGLEVNLSDSKLLESSHQIFVGLISELSAFQMPGGNGAAVQAAFDAAQVGPGEAWLMEQPNPLNPLKRQAFVLAKDSQGLERAAWALRTGESRAWTGGSVKLERREAQERAKSEVPPSSVPLLSEEKELTLRGFTRPEATASQSVPRHWKLEPGARLTLVLQSGLSIRRSGMLEVLLNDRPFASVDLTSGPAGQEAQTVVLKLPADANRDGVLRFGFKLFLDLPEGDCSRTFDESTWVRILTDSSLTLPHTGEQMLNISDFPDRFAEAASLEGAGVMLGHLEAPEVGGDESLESIELTTFLTAASALGARQPEGEQLWLKFLPQADFEAHNAARLDDTQWIVVSSRLQGRLRELITGRWPSGIGKNDRIEVSSWMKQAAFQPEAAVGPKAQAEWSGPAGVLFYVTSPWNPDGSYLLASELDPRGIIKTAHFFEQLWYDKTLSGDVMILRDDLPPLFLTVDSGTRAQAVAEQGGEDQRWFLLALSLGSLGLAGLLYRTIWQQGLRRRG